RQHLALFLREVEERSYREIAGILNTSHSAVETLLFRARRGLVEAFDLLQGATAERCRQAQKATATLLDGEATPVQRRAVAAHVDTCRPCRGQLQQAQRASSVYSAVPLLPVPALLGEHILEGLGGAALVEGGGGALAKFLALLAAKGQMVAVTATVTGGLTVAALVTPADSGPFDAARDRLDAAAAMVEHSQPGVVERSQPGDSQTNSSGGQGATSAGAPEEGPLAPNSTLVGPPLASVMEGVAQAAAGLLHAVDPLGDVSDAAGDPLGPVTDQLPGPGPVGEAIDGIGDAVDPDVDEEIPGVSPSLPLPTVTPPAVPDLGLPGLP
ncbi:MAG: sigma factor-like helix-turn-helix DNA-binding protein, partial [Dehalococcoidia bacterium]|nr:sigma factor-like helix-turn-helix DNA-binding protein [Dehalococcoidia bacterium]